MSAEQKPGLAGLSEAENKAVFTFGVQLSKSLQNIHWYTKRPGDIAVNWPELRGCEGGLIRAAKLAVTERLEVMRSYGVGSKNVALEIIAAERDYSRRNP